MACVGALEQERNAELAEARIDADEEVGRIFVTFDCAELQAFDHRRRAAELAARKHLDLDAAVGGFRKNLGELVAEFFLHVAARDDRPFQRVLGGTRRRDKRGTCGRKQRWRLPRDEHEFS